MKDTFYTYSVYDPVLNMEYIGSRTCVGLKDPETDDNYRGSVSSAKWKDQWKEISKRSTKTVLGVFDKVEDAIAHEIFLHKRHDVANNPMFFNEGRQTSFGFSLGGKNQRGGSNTNADQTLYTFVHPEHGEKICRRGDLIAEYGMCRHNLSKVVKGLRKSIYGWRIKK